MPLPMNYCTAANELSYCCQWIVIRLPMNYHIVANGLSYRCQFIIIYMVMDWHQVINKYLIVVGLLIS